MKTFIKLLPNVQHETPLWSVIIPTFNCASYLKQALTSVLQQDPGSEKMEIVVVDDCSTEDNPRAVVEMLGSGRVKFIQQEQNVGKVRNYETGLKESTGKLIHLLHGDDKVRNGFYENMADAFEKHGEAKAAFCRSIYINSNDVWLKLTGIEQNDTGILEKQFERLLVKQIIQTPAMVVKREVYEEIGLFDRRFDCLEDWEMWIRIAFHYKIAFVNKVLAMYRIHEDNATSSTILNGELIRTHRLLFSIISECYRDKLSKTLKRKIRKHHAEFILQTANDKKLPKKVVSDLKRYALILSFNVKSLYKALT